MIKLYLPALEDLWFRQKLLSDEETMSFNHAYGGVIDFPKEKWYDRWVINHENKRFYCYVIDENKNFVGEVAYHLDEERNVYLENVIIFSAYRRKGYGGQALDLLCKEAKNNGIEVLYDDVANDNPAITMFIQRGFVVEFETKSYMMLKKKL
ncbi:MAG: GNAT family N-acetyltransferase [Bacilli bacterium]|nr:GNAT family N-acetyltransferase [Bacilli bacterium]